MTTRLKPLDRSSLPELEPLFQLVEGMMGFVPNSLMVMARNRPLLEAFLGLGAQALGPGKVSNELKSMVSHVTSRSAGCQYCMAHTGHTTVERAGVARAKFDEIWNYETSPHFTDAERAALRVAQLAALVPNGVEEADRAALAKHFTEEEIVEIVAVIGYFGFLNRWNDTMATPLEATPMAFGEAALATAGWHPGKHGR
ncbi:MAG: carboxymuconolactone decarboxylase family protein [Alphaproteobacteria bacterium]|nr:carboxymuconolactone decarboxylase family protein [Alphaproteobacteria bacterium]